MKKFVAYLEKKDPETNKVITKNCIGIITDNDKDLDYVIDMFQKKYNHTVGQANMFGAILVKIQEEPMKDNEFFPYSKYETL